MSNSNILDFDLTVEDTILGHALKHEFKGNEIIPGLSFSKSEGVVTFEAVEAHAVVTASFKVLGNTVWHQSFSEAGNHKVDLKLGTGSVVGTISLS